MVCRARRRAATGLRACFENIPGGLAGSEQIIGMHCTAVLGRGGWLRCSSVTDFSRICSLVGSEQIMGCPLCGLPRHPPRRARNPFPGLFSKHALNKRGAISGACSAKRGAQFLLNSGPQCGTNVAMTPVGTLPTVRKRGECREEMKIGAAQPRCNPHLVESNRTRRISPPGSNPGTFDTLALRQTPNQ